MIQNEQKRPVRFKTKVKKVARCIIAFVPFVCYLHTKLSLKIGKYVERKCYNIMIKYNLLENFIK